MSARPQQAPQCVYALASHLDAILAVCEDLNNEVGSAEFIRLELTAITHALQARRRLQELWIDDDALADQADMFLIATGDLARSRKLTAPETVPTEDPCIGGQTPAGIIADLASDLLDVLEARYGALWPDQSETQTGSSSLAAPEIRWSR